MLRLLSFLPIINSLLPLRISAGCVQYHGGTSFGRTTGGPFLTTSYDYDAPLDEYGEPACRLPTSCHDFVLKTQCGNVLLW